MSARKILNTLLLRRSKRAQERAIREWHRGTVRPEGSR